MLSKCAVYHRIVYKFGKQVLSQINGAPEVNLDTILNPANIPTTAAGLREYGVDDMQVTYAMCSGLKL